ncbi:MAG: single-stranded DNA-binding protein, partial [Sciscionella sp.]
SSAASAGCRSASPWGPETTTVDLVSVFGEMMEELPDDLAKGERVYIEGKLRVSRWIDQTC